MIALFRSWFAPPRHLILLLAALWLGASLAEKRAQRHRISSEALNNVVYYSVLGYVIGGRLLFVLANLSAFVPNPLSTFSLNPDLFDPTGALITGVLVGLIYGRRQGLPLLPALDALTPLFAIIAIGLSLSHLAAGTAFGSPTTLPWGIELWNATRHPSQIYELIVAFIIFALIWFRKRESPPGMEFLLFTSLTAGAYLFLDAFREDSRLIFGGIRLGQILAWLLLALTIFTSESIRREERSD